MDDINKNTKQNVTIQIQPVTMTETANPMTVVMRAYYSSYHLWAAKHFCRLAHNIENEAGGKPRFDIKHRAKATGFFLEIS